MIVHDIFEFSRFFSYRWIRPECSGDADSLFSNENSCIPPHTLFQCKLWSGRLFRTYRRVKIKIRTSGFRVIQLCELKINNMPTLWMILSLWRYLNTKVIINIYEWSNVESILYFCTIFKGYYCPSYYFDNRETTRSNFKSDACIDFFQKKYPLNNLHSRRRDVRGSYIKHISLYRRGDTYYSYTIVRNIKNLKMRSLIITYNNYLLRNIQQFWSLINWFVRDKWEWASTVNHPVYGRYNKLMHVHQVARI